MNEQLNYVREFAKSPHHLVLGFCTLGLGFIAAGLLPFLLGMVGYVFGWIWIPGTPLFKGWVEKKVQTQLQAEDAVRLDEFNSKRQLQLYALSAERRSKYAILSGICEEIEKTSGDGQGGGDPVNDSRSRKLDELMWTYLRLLSVEQSLETFVNSESGEDIEASVKQAEKGIAVTQKSAEDAKTSGDEVLASAKERLLASTSDRLDVLRKRLDRFKQASTNIEVVRSEQERLAEQIKLIRADAMATKNADALTSRIDASVQTLNDTNKFLSDMSDFADLASDVPMTTARIGFKLGDQSIAPVPPGYTVTDRAQRRRRQCARN